MTRTTVLIPLHRAERWRDQLLEQLSELSGVAQLIVSDATGEDDSLDRLRRSIAHESIAHESITHESIAAESIEWIGPRPLATGWVAHANDLQARARTEFVMWLPQDDFITREWILEAEAQLDRQPEAVAACGPISPLAVDSRGRGIPVDVPPFASIADPVERVTHGIDRLLFGQSSDLGIFFRSVTRRDAAPPLPPGIIDDEWSDVLWAILLLTRGPIASIAPAYGKRWHDHNTHGNWRDHAGERPDLVRLGIMAMLNGLRPEQRDAVIANVWASDVERLRQECRQLRTDAEDRERYWSARHAGLWRDVENSMSWRMTAPARAIASTVRRVIPRASNSSSSSMDASPESPPESR